MPIPKIKGKVTPKDIVAKYHEFGWNRVINFDWVTIGRNGEIYRQNYRFDARSKPCTKKQCAPHHLQFYEFRSTGVFWTCATCRRTEGPVTMEDGVLNNGPNGERISQEQAWDIIRSTGQHPPLGLNQNTAAEGMVIVSDDEDEELTFK